MFAYIATALWVLCWLVSECVQLMVVSDGSGWMCASGGKWMLAVYVDG